jgi:3D (Asp-Asp-Asp) domain-containing protein
MFNPFRDAGRVRRNNIALFICKLGQQTRTVLHNRLGAATFLVFSILIGFSFALNSVNFFLVEINGRANFFTSFSSDVVAVLSENGYTLSERDSLTGQLTAQRGFASAVLEQRYPITIVMDGQQKIFYSSHGETVLSALSGAGIQLRALDRVNPSVMETTNVNMRIEIIEVSLEYNSIDEEAVLLEVAEQRRLDQVRLAEEKKLQEKTHTQARQYMAGNTVSPIIYRPAAGILPAEQGDNVLVTREGTFSYIAKFDGECTAYCSGTHTATGTRVRVGAVAVDPKVIPLKSKLYILAADGTSWMYGYAVAEDTGGAVKGNIVDLYMPDYDDCINFGRRKATIYVLE